MSRSKCLLTDSLNNDSINLLVNLTALFECHWHIMYRMVRIRERKRGEEVRGSSHGVGCSKTEVKEDEMWKEAFEIRAGSHRGKSQHSVSGPIFTSDLRKRTKWTNRSTIQLTMWQRYDNNYEDSLIMVQCDVPIHAGKLTTYDECI
jgi:hypothetical protein